MKGQISFEYLVLIAVGAIIAAIVVMIASNLLALKGGIGQLIDTYIAKFIGG